MPFKIPEGWKQETLSLEGYILITSPDKFMVTIDFINRHFRSGLSSHGRTVNQIGYRGRNWKQHIVDDAVSWLITETK